MGLAGIAPAVVAAIAFGVQYVPVKKYKSLGLLIHRRFVHIWMDELQRLHQDLTCKGNHHQNAWFQTREALSFGNMLHIHVSRKRSHDIATK